MGIEATIEPSTGRQHTNEEAEEEEAPRASGGHPKGTQTATTATCCWRPSKPNCNQLVRTIRTTRTTSQSSPSRGPLDVRWRADSPRHAPQDLSPPGHWALLMAATCLLVLAGSLECTRWPSGTKRRASRQSWEANEAANQQLPDVPYQTFYLTQACEWKSNLFVPKSNDILFAQQTGDETVGPATTTLRLADSSEQETRTMLSSSSRALILSLPVHINSASFAGYEPACSIRLIVPRNMRILAKLTSRRLNFEQFEQSDSPDGGGNLNNLDLNGISAPPQQPKSQLWLNVSQNEFSETEQRTIETEGNILAFRFLLERFANKQVADTRFQAVLTAFQTFAENSDTNLGGFNWPSQQNERPTGTTATLHQFICDSQRLISTSLACDGFKNCQDGTDEEPRGCASVRNGPQPALNDLQPTRPSSTNSTRNQVMSATDLDSPPVSPIRRLLNYLNSRESSSLAGFLFGFLLVLVLLTCCTCCLYCLYLLWRKYSSSRFYQRRRQARVGSASGGDDDDDQMAASARLARQQNLENLNRLKQQQQQQLQQPRPPPRSSLMSSEQQQRHLQSILKRPGAPLARFEATPVARPSVPPPSRPPRQQPTTTTGGGGDHDGQPSRRGALASSLRDSDRRARPRPTAGAGQFPPTPAARRGQPMSASQQPGEQQSLLIKPQQAPEEQQAAGRQFDYISRTTKLEQQTTSTKTGNEGDQKRTTTSVFEYSSNVAQYSQSYLLEQAAAARQAQGRRQSGRVAPPSGGQSDQEEDDDDSQVRHHLI